MTPRAARPARASTCMAGLCAARLALRLAPMGIRARGDDVDDIGHRLPALRGSIPILPRHQEPHARDGLGSDGGSRKAGGPVRSSALSGEAAAASLAVSGGRFHFCSTSLSTEVWSSTSLQTKSRRAYGDTTTAGTRNPYRS